MRKGGAFATKPTTSSSGERHRLRPTPASQPTAPSGPELAIFDAACSRPSGRPATTTRLERLKTHRARCAETLAALYHWCSTEHALKAAIGLAEVLH